MMRHLLKTLHLALAALTLAPGLSALAIAATNDPNFQKQWALTQTKVETAWKSTKGSAAVKVAIIATGVDQNHPDLKTALLSGYNAVLNNSTTEDALGLGTAMAGIIAASVDNSIGIAGIAPNVKILPVLAQGADGSPHESFTKAITWAVTNGAQIILMPLGTPQDSLTLKSAVESARAKGIIIIAASGDGGATARVTYPARYALDNIISVAASDKAGKLMASSALSGERPVTIAAPGAQILTTLPAKPNMPASTNYGELSGTGPAAAMVAGAVALAKSINPQASVATIKEKLCSTASKSPSLQNKVTCGGIIDIGAFVTAMKP